MELELLAKNIERRENGIYFAKTDSTISYPEEGNQNCFQIESNSFWFNHRNNVIANRVLKYNKGKAFFDIGGGNGFVSRRLQDDGVPVVLVEPGLSGATNAKNSGVSNVLCSTLEDAEFKPESLDSAGMFDVIEHIENDRNFLSKTHKFLKQGGLVYATVPAYNFLWSKEDVDAGHFRRYSFKSFSKLFEDSGFEVIYSTYFFCVLPVPVFLFRTLPSKLGLNKNSNSLEKHKKEHSSEKGMFTGLMNKFLGWELNKISSGKQLPFGGSCFIVAKKTGNTP